MIVQAARALYARHSVEAIARNDAGAKNLGATSSAVERIIERCRARAGGPLAEIADNRRRCRRGGAVQLRRAFDAVRPVEAQRGSP
jgi:hypothetical protein